MEELYQICNKYFLLLSLNNDKLSTNMQKLVTKDRTYLRNVLDIINKSFDDNNLDLRSLVNFCKIGNILNLDLLTDLLINVKKSNVIDLTKKILMINIMLDNLVMLIRKKYNQDFFTNNMLLEFFTCVNKEEYFCYMNRLLLCGNNMLFFNKKDDIKTNLIYEDLLSEVIDNGNYNLIINEWKFFREYLLLARCGIKRLMCINKSFELTLFFNFINDLDMFVEERIKKLSFKKIDRVIIKKFNYE